MADRTGVEQQPPTAAPKSLALLGRWPSAAHAALSLVQLAIIGLVDYLTGYELGVSLFYLLPVCWCAWFLGRTGGLLASVACAVVWAAADQAAAHRYSSWFVLYWNAGLRLGIFVVVALLLSMLRQTLQRVDALSRTDPLTLASNPRAVEDALSAELARLRRYHRALTVAYIDLDNFKTVNDSRGHSIGNQALRTVADVIRATLRQTDLLGRLGGDEFAILLPETDEGEAQVALSKLRARLREAMAANGWPVGFSIGCVTCEDWNRSADDVLDLADQTMYSVKTSGKNSILFRSVPAPTAAGAQPPQHR